MNPLESLGLRDITTPAPPGWWPPAPGWWLLGLLGLLATWAAWRWLHARRRTRLLRLAEVELDALRRHAGEPGFAAAVSRWLRQVALLHYGPRQVAGLSGRRWLEHLDQALGGKDFREGPGAQLEQAPYRRDPRCEDPATLIELCARWLRALRREAG